MPPDEVTPRLEDALRRAVDGHRHRADHSGEAEHLRETGGGVGGDRPVVVRIGAAGGVVAVDHRHEIRLARRRPPGCLLGRGAPARAGREERRRDRVPVPDDPMDGGGDGGGRRGRLVLDRPVHLAAGVGIGVEGAGGVPGGDGVGAGGDGLRLQGGRRPRRGHLARDDATQVLLDADEVDAQQARPGDQHPERAVPVIADEADAGGVVQLQRLGTGVDRDRGDQAFGHRPRRAADELEMPGGPTDLQVVEAGRELLGRAGRVAERHAGGGAEVHRRPGRQQHALGRPRRQRPDVRAREVVVEDLGVAPAVLGVPERAVLGHADAVPPAVAGQRENRRGLRGGRQKQRGRRCDTCG